MIEKLKKDDIAVLQRIEEAQFNSLVKNDRVIESA
jgi:hypothetical protein